MTEPVARTVKDFCRAYGISRATVYRLLATGQLQAVKVSATKTLIPEESAKAWLKNLQDMRNAATAKYDSDKEKLERALADAKDRRDKKRVLEEELERLEALEGSDTKLYRHFDQNKKLLYVGISLNAVARLSGHRSTSSWFENIATVKIETFPNREAALMAERLAILKEKPLYNRHHNDCVPPLVPTDHDELV
jgi:excisionase family DNA binding protein